MKNRWTRLASTYGCIQVKLSTDYLNIQPHWFAVPLIVPLALDLSHQIPTTKIRDVKPVGNWMGYGKVQLSFETADGKAQRILLYLKKFHEFIDTVERIRSQNAQ